MTLTQPDVSSGPQSVDRALHVLELLASRGTGGVSEIADEIGVHKSTAFRLLGALEARHLVEQTTERGKYRLAFGLVRLARRVNVQLELTEHARDVTEQLASALGESTNVAVLQEHYAVNVVQARGHASVVSQNWIGQLTPLHATSSGKVLMAHLDDDARTRLVTRPLERFTPRTRIDPVELDEELVEVVERGFATTYGELEIGLNAVAVPVRNEGGQVIAALSVSGPAYRFSNERIAEVVSQIEEAGGDLSERLGYWTPERWS